MAPEAFPFLRRPLPADTYPPEAPLGHVLTRMGLGRRERASFHVLLGDRAVVQVDAGVDGRETIRVPAGEFEAWRIHMRPSAASLFPSLPALAVRFASFFIPRPTVWLSVAEPQRFRQFAGTMGPPGTPSLHVRLETIAAAGGGPGGGAEAP